MILVEWFFMCYFYFVCFLYKIDSSEKDGVLTYLQFWIGYDLTFQSADLLINFATIDLVV